MKKLNDIVFVSGAEIKSHGSTPSVKGRIRFNSTSDIWEYTNDNGVTWYPFSPIPSGGTSGQILRKNSNTDFDASWSDLAEDAVTTVNGMVGDVTIGGFAALTCYVVGNGGNDATAEIGNILRPFETIGAAIQVAKDNPGALIEVLPGTYDIYDGDTPGPGGTMGGIGYGLMYPNSNYSYYFHPNARVNYYGTYGFYISGIGSDGDILGYGVFHIWNATFSATVSDPYSGSITNYGMYIHADLRTRRFDMHRIIFESSASTANGIYSGYSNQTGINFIIGERILARGGSTLTLSRSSRTTFNGPGSIQSTSFTEPCMVIDGVHTAQFINLGVFSYGNAFGRNADTMCEITFNGSFTNEIQFIRTTAYFVSSTTNYKLFNLNNAVINDNFSFDKSLLKGRQSTSFTIGGNSIFSNFNSNIKFIDTYGSLDIGGSGTITNPISGGGIGFVYNPNI